MKTCPKCKASYPDDHNVCTADATALIASTDLPAGTVLARKYRIVAKLGQDAVCTVYKAQQVKSNQLRTLKVMNEDLAADSDFVNLFQQDVQLRKKLQHPNISHVEGIDESEDGRPFIVMEFVDGHSLQEVIQTEAPLAPLRVCALARQVSAGLEAAHALGVVHRDVKPESIFLVETSHGESTKLLGFGISKLKEALLGDRFLTSPEAVIGTLQYLSPEQALGKLSDELDGRADIYSLGVVMYQMLTGHLPYHADTDTDWMLAHIQGMPTPIRVGYPNLGIPDVMIDLVMYCLQKDREKRPESARELIRDIELVEKEIDRAAKAKPAVRKPLGSSKGSGWKFWKS